VPFDSTTGNDRISFKNFLGLSFDQFFPDHSTFSRFRSRLSKDAMAKINSDVLRQFTSRGGNHIEGIAIDARLVQSAFSPLSKERLKEEKNKRETPEGKVDKNGKPLKFSCDLESDWTIKNDVAHFGLKEHASSIRGLSWQLKSRPLCVAKSCHIQEGADNLNKIEDGIMRKATAGTELTEYEKDRNKAISKLRYIVGTVFRFKPFVQQSKQGKVKNAFDALFRQMVFNLFRASRILKTA